MVSVPVGEQHGDNVETQRLYGFQDSFRLEPRIDDHSLPGLRASDDIAVHQETTAQHQHLDDHFLYRTPGWKKREKVFAGANAEFVIMETETVGETVNGSNVRRQTISLDFVQLLQAQSGPCGKLRHRHFLSATSLADHIPELVLKLRVHAASFPGFPEVH